ncbi:MAG: penicillin-binding protein [Bacteroidota bacterium]
MSDNKKSILMRSYLIYVLVLIFSFVIIGKLIYIQFVQGPELKKKAEKVSIEYDVVKAVRGNIYAEDDNLLATSVNVYEVGMDVNPKVIPDSIWNKKIDSLSGCLGRTFNKPKKFFLDKLERARHNFVKDSLCSYVLLKHQVPYDTMKMMKKFPIFRLGKNRGGMVVNTMEIREFPYGNLANRTIGYMQLAQYKIKISFRESKIGNQDFIKQLDTLALCMFNLFGDHSQKYYVKLLTDCYYKGVPIKRTVDQAQLAKLEKLPLLEDMGKFSGFEQKLITDKYMVGLEGAYDPVLRGTDGTTMLKKIGGGVWKELENEELVKPKNGFDLYTSLDCNLQDVAESALRRCLDSNNAEWGCTVLMEVKTGCVKAIVNLTRGDNGKYKEVYNYAIGRQIEPGSTFKLASLMAVLEENPVDPEKQMVNVGPMLSPTDGKPIDDSHNTGGSITLQRAFEISSNRGTSRITWETFHNKTDKLRRLFNAMGLIDSLNLDIPGDKGPYMGDANRLLYNLPRLAFGYSIKLTPIHILAFYNAVANNGVFIKPRFIEAIGKSGVELMHFNPIVLRQAICSKETLAKVRKMLEGVVERGTASNINKSVFKIAGKTGTAKIYDEKAKTWLSQYVASFVGYFPADAPLYSCIVVVYKPNGTEFYGSQIAAPVFKEIADRVYAKQLGIHSEPPKFNGISIPVAKAGYQDDLSTIYKVLNFKVISPDTVSDWVTVSRENFNLRFAAKPVNAFMMPDVTGMTAKDAVFMLEKMGLNVKINGKGKVKSQSLKTGQKIVRNQSVTLVLGIV